MAAGLILTVASNALRDAAKELERKEAALQKGRIRALNRTVITGRKEAIVVVGKDLNITKKKPVRDAMIIKKANKNEPEAKVRSDRRARKARIPIVAFGPRQKKSKGKRLGVTVQVFRAGPRVTLKPAFFGYKKKGVYVRARGAKRHPIRQLFGPPVHSVFAHNLPEIVEVTANALEKNLEREVAFALRS